MISNCTHLNDGFLYTGIDCYVLCHCLSIYCRPYTVTILGSGYSTVQVTMQYAEYLVWWYSDLVSWINGNNVCSYGY